MAITDLTAAEIAGEVRRGALRPTEILEAYFKRIEDINPEIKAYILLLKERAFSKARDIEARQARGVPLGTLAGVPVAVKDNILIEDYPVTCGSKIMAGYKATYSATALRRLEEQDALVLGKTNLDEFAMGSSTENSAFGPSKNPWDTARVPGGSSGGSAAAVASAMACVALGSDTGGSIRQPASYCGLVGFKPTYGRVSRYGLVAFASSLDQIGPMTRTAEDARLVFESMAGYDPMDSTSLNPGELENLRKKAAPGLQRSRRTAGKIGFPKEFFSMQGIDPEVLEALNKAGQILGQDGFNLSDINLPHSRFTLPAYYILAPAEASANLARFDGMRYGHRVGLKGPGSGVSESGEGELLSLYKKNRTQGFGPEVQRRILIGTFALSQGYYDQYYGRAALARALISKDFAEAFERVDFILTPTAPSPAFKLGDKTQDPMAMYLCDIFTIPANLSGLPAVSLCCGFSTGGLPIGFQIVGPKGSDEEILELAVRWEKITNGEFIRLPPPASPATALKEKSVGLNEVHHD